MEENKKKSGFMEIIKTGFGYLSQIVSASIFPKLEQGTEILMKNIDDKIIIIENRIFRKACSLLVILIGAVFLVLSLLFFLIEHVKWSTSASLFLIGIILFVIGVFLKLGKPYK